MAKIEYLETSYTDTIRNNDMMNEVGAEGCGCCGCIVFIVIFIGLGILFIH
jgi:hypothetical protein